MGQWRVFPEESLFQCAAYPTIFGSSEMSPHGSLCGDRVSSLQGLKYVFVFPYGRGPGQRAFRVTAHCCRDRIVAAIEQFPHKASEHGVTRSLGDQHVELPVRLHRRFTRSRKPAHSFD